MPADLADRVERAEQASREFLPCPFCGGEDVVIAIDCDERVWFCGCCTCYAEGPTKPTKAATVAAWNTRAERP